MAPNSSAVLRAEFDAVMAGFDKMPVLPGNAGLLVRVNATGDALEASSAIAGLTLTGGTINGAVIGNISPAAITGTTITAPIISGGAVSASAGFTGNLTGNVSGSITSAGSSSFNNVTVTGTLDMSAGTGGTLTGLSYPAAATEAAHKQYVDDVAAALVNGAPANLNTLSELAASINNDPAYAATTAADLATKLPLAGGTMTGQINMSGNKITGLPYPSVDTDATTLGFMTSLYGTTAAAAVSAAAALTSETAAANSATSAATAEASALTYWTNIEAQVTIPITQMAANLINTQAIVVAHHAFA